MRFLESSVYQFSQLKKGQQIVIKMFLIHPVSSFPPPPPPLTSGFASGPDSEEREREGGGGGVGS